MINIYEPEINSYKTSAINAINSGWISNHGEYIQKSTNKIVELLNINYAILMANGTCATHCLFLSLKFKYPEITTIYVPNNAYIASWNCALMVYNIENLKVMKMNLKTWNIDTDEEYIKNLDKNSALLIVHNLGNIINIPRLKKIRPDLIFIEDNCEGLFGKYDGIYSGSSCDILCSSASFYGNKIITTGEGGLFLTMNEDVYNYIKQVYSQGMSSDIKYLHNIHAYNYRMTNIEAGFLYDQLNDIDNILNNKRNIFQNYENLLDFLIKDNKIVLFEKEDNTQSSDWIFSLRIIGNTKSIKETNDFFKNNDIDIRPFFYPINKHTHLIDIENNDINSDILNREIIMIPSSPNITNEEQLKIVKIIFEFILYIKNIKVVKITNDNIYILDCFIKIIDNRYFRYFNKRDSKCIDSHINTYLFYDTIKEIYFGYTHIDYVKDENKYWFGIYLDSFYHGLNLGNLLLNYTLNFVNIDEINLSVDTNNEKAIKLYKKNGFIINEKSNDKIYFMNKKLTH